MKIPPTLLLSGSALFLLSAGFATLALTVPNEIQQPGTQPLELFATLENPSACDGCHGSYDQAVEPLYNFQGSMMAHASRDPLFWAAMAVAEQDFDGSGDLCLRCHTPTGWLDGRSTPTDGSAMLASDAEGVTCDVCHSLVNPDTSEYAGVQNSPFVANDGGMPAEGYYGSGMMVVTNNTPEKFGPYTGVFAPHGTNQSSFHRSPEFCGTCHDVSNPAVGDLAPDHGAQDPSAVSYEGTLGGTLADKAAFNNKPHAYGAVERTFSEYKSSGFDGLPVSDFPDLPPLLQAGSIASAYDAAQLAGNGGDFEDGSTRYYTCQSCHMQPTVGKGCVVGSAPVRSDLAVHDLTGGNYWMPDAIQYLDGMGLLRLGGGLSSTQMDAMDDGKLRAQRMLEEAAALRVEGNTLKVVNLTGHKLISGYPEGRRMWLNVKWFDRFHNLIREDGAYGPINVMIGGSPAVVDSIQDLSDPNLHLYQAHMAITQEWASALLTLGYPSGMVVSYDRTSEAATKTLGQIAAQSPGTWHESFHFVLNDYMAADNRIPPWRFRYDDALERSALPVPDDQYGDPGPGAVYRYWDEVDLNPPAGAVKGKIRLLYQPTSWEYIQFLYLANDGSITFLDAEGDNLLDAWLNTGMAAPHVMATAEWRKWRWRSKPLIGR